MVTGILLIILLTIFIIDYFINSNRHIAEVVIATGLTIITNGFLDLNQLMLICLAHFNGENIVFKDYLDSEINFFLISIGIVIFLVGFYLKAKKEIMLLNISSFSDKQICIKDLNNLKENKFDVSTLYDEFAGNKGTDSPILLKDFTKRITEYGIEQRHLKNAYTGIASIPLVLYAGTKIKEISFDIFYEYNKQTQKFNKLRKLAVIKKLKLNLESENVDNTREILLAFGITTKIKESDVVQFKNMKKYIFNIDRVEDTVDNIITAKNQLNYYSKFIYDTIRKMAKEHPKIKTIHIVLSAQSCLAIELGKLIEDRNICEIIAYQFSYNGSIKYPWGMKINGSEAGKYVGGKE